MHESNIRTRTTKIWPKQSHTTEKTEVMFSAPQTCLTSERFTRCMLPSYMFICGYISRRYFHMMACWFYFGGTKCNRTATNLHVENQWSDAFCCGIRSGSKDFFASKAVRLYKSARYVNCGWDFTVNMKKVCWVQNAHKTLWKLELARAMPSFRKFTVGLFNLVDPLSKSILLSDPLLMYISSYLYMVMHM